MMNASGTWGIGKWKNLFLALKDYKEENIRKPGVFPVFLPTTPYPRAELHMLQQRPVTFFRCPRAMEQWQRKHTHTEISRETVLWSKLAAILILELLTSHSTTWNIHHPDTDVFLGRWGPVRIDANSAAFNFYHLKNPSNLKNLGRNPALNDLEGLLWQFGLETQVIIMILIYNIVYVWVSPHHATICQISVCLQSSLGEDQHLWKNYCSLTHTDSRQPKNLLNCQ